ncbi:dynein heavy chain and region D6 of dynein motor-domain-containing protein [Pelagophyceae sp. CCMP2097]|nr:dynein heavy chain and region D6 of dynein motor-domain-containing protein [Pelagophyceae sp. CCMP2097]
MALQARHRYMVSRINEAFALGDEEAVEELIRREHIIGRINAFFRADGPTRIFVFCEQLEAKAGRGRRATLSQTAGRAGGAPQDEPVARGRGAAANERVCLYFSDGSDVATLPPAALARTVYFMKRSPTAADEAGVALDPLRSNDGAMFFGTVAAPLQSLEALLRALYVPALRRAPQKLWGRSARGHTHEFLVSVDGFVKNVQENIKSLGSGLELRQPDADVAGADAFEAAAHPAVAAHYIDLLEEWCGAIEVYLSDSDRSRWETSDSGPDSELEYWRRRMQRLTSITDQLKTKRCKAVLVLLTAMTKQPGEAVAAHRQHVFGLMRRWRSIDVAITKAANEAKDNAKFLGTLDRFLEPLQGGTPNAIVDAVPALLNALKMVHTISRFFNTTERMTKLFMKITNQMIKSCKLAVLGSDDAHLLWDADVDALLATLESCLRLNEFYQEQYRVTKDKLLTMPKGKQFDFAEAQIFGKFDLFCRRVIKLIDMFSTMQQFHALVDHKLEGMEPLLVVFDQIITQFRAKKHDLLDYHNNKFDRDYVEFNVRIGELETSLQHFINRSFESISSIEQSLALLKKYQAILHRENLRSDLDSKFMVIFHNYGLELAAVQEAYEAHKHAPPAPRNMPPVAGNILWARHLLRRIEAPMQKFAGNAVVLASKESKRIVRVYNKVAKTLVAFEYVWYEAWCKSVDAAKAGLRATLVVRHPASKKLFVNFDAQVFQLMREAKCLARLGVAVPEAARAVLAQEEQFKAHHDALAHALADYDRVCAAIQPSTAQALAPHLRSMECRLRPGMVTLTWTSLNIDAYKADVDAGLVALDGLIAKINDLVENRVEKNLKVIARTILVDLPSTTVTLDEFVSMQEAAVREKTTSMMAKNLEVETAVEDLVAMLKTFPLDASVPPLRDEDLSALRSHYNRLTYQALLSCTRNSLITVKKRVCARSGSTIFSMERSFFVVDVQLSVPSVRLSPSLDDVQRAINRAATAVLGCSKQIWEWGQLGQPDDAGKVAFFERLGRDTEIIKVALLLTGALFATRQQVRDYLVVFKKYDWLWKDDKDARYRKFAATNPSIADYEQELRQFMDVEQELLRVAPVHTIGALALNTSNLKLQLRNESRQWKVQYSTRVHQTAKESMTALLEYVRVTQKKLHVDVHDLDSLRFVMNTLREIRDRESAIEMELAPIFDMYSMLEHYLPGGLVDKEEMDRKMLMRPSWRKLMDLAEDVADELSAIQGQYKKQLVHDVREFAAETRAFRADFDANGPQVPGIAPQEAVERLRRFKDELQVRERKMEMYLAGEELFALRTTKFPELLRTRKEVGLLDQLYGLYLDVLQAVELRKAVLWSDVEGKLPQMVEETKSFDARCKKMPKRLREWQAYADLQHKLSDFQEVLPLIAELSKPSIKARHWLEVFDAMKQTLPFDKEAFCVQDMLESPILKAREQVEEICDGADKQLGIESRLQELKEHWARAVFSFSVWKGRDVAILSATGGVIDDLEEAQLQLQALLAMRHVSPFRAAVTLQLTALSDTADTLELWVKVQLLWTALESVFMGGDIAKQMPLEAKKFAKIDRDFVKVMQKAAETKFCVACCGNELLRNTLPVLYAELEKCQKSLEGYLEQKRSTFPRFYFVSNPVLLLILSQGSDPLRMQPYYEKVFDSVNQVDHNRIDKARIVAMKNINGSDEEVVQLANPVAASGSIELWLGSLVSEMQRSLKALCEVAAVQCASLPLAQFVDTNCAQFALLGIQFNWTAQCQDALERSKTSKTIIAETNKQQLAVLVELSSWCLTDLGSQQNRRKVETLVTIHVHQRDVFADLAKLSRDRKSLDAGDFEWLKQARFYWRPDAHDDHGKGACVISICDVDFRYCHEYLGCKERLVITPLTDRCYITLSQALGMHLGGAPAGPAGTGKTETVKDLGRALGIFVVVTNCTDQQRFTDMAKIFKGLCQAGLWGCFDEFNRIELPVLSVVAQQVLAITNAKRVGAPQFAFPGDAQVVRLNANVGYFITMNPGYAGRQELPENLKVLFRSVAMMVPDREIIMKVKLCAVGYQHFTELARKFDALYRLCEQQLSKQKHYDFGLRNILSVLRSAGQTKRDHPGEDESKLLLNTLRSMNLSKFVAQDVALFLTLLDDLFPGIKAPAGGAGDKSLDTAVTASLAQRKAVDHATWRLKLLQLHETTLVRHGIMLVGPPGSGKSKIIQVLQDALSSTTSVPHKRIRMNPKAIRPEEMFGETDRTSGEWLNGIFAAIWAKFNDRARRDVTWIVCDGPVDAVWIENLNTVLDDNKLLTLANGDRIPMADNVKLLFEVEDLRNASPATVSRAGIIYVSDVDLDWPPVLEAWLRQRPQHGDVLRAHFARYLGAYEPDVATKSRGVAFDFLASECTMPIQASRVGLVEATCALMDAVLQTAELSESRNDAAEELDRLVLFALSWGVAGLLEADDRRKWDAWLRSGPAQAAANMPRDVAEGESIFEYSVNPETMEWERWAPEAFALESKDVDDWSTVLVPTTETCRGVALMTHCQRRRTPVLVAGGSGTAKSSTAGAFFETFRPESMLLKKINFSNATTPGMFQAAVEGELDKQGGKNFGPPAGKSMTVFVDDLAMPEVNKWGDQATLEVVRQLVECSGVCFLDKDKRGDVRNIERLLYVAAMDHPGGGKNDVPNRLKRHFFMYTIIAPSDATITSIYGSLLAARFSKNPEFAQFYAGGLETGGAHLAGFVERMPRATMALFTWARARLLPSPSKFHYTFTLRDLARMFQGVLRTPRSTFLADHVAVQLWRHEAERVFADKLVNLEDKALFAAELDLRTAALVHPAAAPPPSVASMDSPASPSKSGTAKGKGRKTTTRQNSDSFKSPTPSNKSIAAPGSDDVVDKCNERAYFVDFLRDAVYDDDGQLVEEAPKTYELGGSLPELRVRVLSFLQRHNETFPARQMHLVVFDDALQHLLRLSRVLGMPRGSMMLVGVGGSGKQSLTNLAAFIAGHELFQIAVTKTYTLNSFLDDIRAMYKACSQQRRKATFVFTDAQIKDENFLEVLNSFLTTGEVSGLFPKDEVGVMAADLRAWAAKRPDYADTPEFLAKNFYDTVRANLHVVLCFSPVNVKFAERARKFPGLINGTSVDWFLTWPKEALLSVSRGFIESMGAELQGDAATKESLMQHMAYVHGAVVESCDEYYQTMRRRVYQTPRSYLSFLADYRSVYSRKLAEVENKASRVVVGLDKLRQGAEDVESMKVVLADEEVELRAANATTTAMLGDLQRSSMAAKKEADSVQKIKEGCLAEAAAIGEEKRAAEKDLAAAQPFVDEAERAVNSIKPADLNELKKLQKPSDIIKLIFDVVGILKMEKLEKVTMAEITLGIGKEKTTFNFPKDSFKLCQQGMLADSRFLQHIFTFSKHEKDFINDETIELMMPYLELEGYSALVARNASKAAEGLCIWSRAMSSYTGAAKIVKPKLEALKLAEARLADAQRDLDRAEAKLQACLATLAGLQQDFEAQMDLKKRLEESAAATRVKMEMATNLISGLAGERARWTQDAAKFDSTKRALVGDVAVGCAFVSYCGPFNQEFREAMVHGKLTADLKKRSVPCTASLDIVALLADVGTIGDWNQEGLPTDLLSIQNGILVTRSSRYPLLIDPQGQALHWIRKHEADRMPLFGLSTMNHPKLRDHVELSMAEGKALIVTCVEEELDPILDPVLQKQIVTKGKSKYINIGDKLCEYNDDFMAYFITRLPNPSFSPEDQAKTTVVDFTVTMKGLEEQLLGRVIQKEQRSLEEQLTTVLEEVANNTKALLRLDELLLERLSASSGNLLDDAELIAVLAETKSKATEVNDKLVAAAATRESINDKRESYRPAATRGSVLYFVVVDVSRVNVMYQTSLDQFQALFDSAMDGADRAAVAAKRVHNIIDTMTYTVYRAVNRGLYERDRLAFKLLLLFTMLLTAGRLTAREVTLFLKGGAALDVASAPKKPASLAWLSGAAWLNAVQLGQDCVMFKDLPEDLARNEAAWKHWYAENEPEKREVPTYDARFDAGGSGAFARLLLIRALREDRVILVVHEFIRTSEFLDAQGAKLPCLGPRYVENVQDTLEASIYPATSAATPVVFLLSAGADPTESVEAFARRRKKAMHCVSMGEGQEPVALRAINSAAANGEWVVLQNSHLGLPFMDALEDVLAKIRADVGGAVQPDFRLFITTEPHAKFPIGLLQLAVKVTTEPPAGLSAGLQRSFAVLVDRDRMERVETAQWRALLYALCFAHSAAQERRKFGPLGWCVPYEFNDGDLNAAVTFLERHLALGALSWPTLQYMVSEVCYGGKITDDYDRRLFGTYASAWLAPQTAKPGFNFAPDVTLQSLPEDFHYAVPQGETHDAFAAYAKALPKVDSPEIFGLHPNADLTCRNTEVQQLLGTIIETQPKAGSSAGGRTREDVVYDKCAEVLPLMPADYKEDDYLRSLDVTVPLSAFLAQELQRFQKVVNVVRAELLVIMQAIRGEVVITRGVVAGVDALYDARVPPAWVFSPSGDEVSWQAPTIGLWVAGVAAREHLFRNWLDRGRPRAFWLPGLFNPCGFLTAVQQEVTRAHAADGWALDGVAVVSEVTEYARADQVPKAPAEGVFVHGLSLDGAAWDRANNALCESAPKALFCDLPVLYVTCAAAAKKAGADLGPHGGYQCPVYKYYARTDRHFICAVQLGTAQRPQHWILRGVALLCFTN